MSILCAIKTPTSSKFIGNQHSVRCSASNSCLCSCRSYKRTPPLAKRLVLFTIYTKTLWRLRVLIVLLEVETWQFQVAWNRARAVSLCCTSIKWAHLVYESQRSCTKRKRERERRKGFVLRMFKRKKAHHSTLGTLCSSYDATMQTWKEFTVLLMPCLNCTISWTQGTPGQWKGISSPFSVSSCQGERQSAYRAIGKHKSP